MLDEIIWMNLDPIRFSGDFGLARVISCDFLARQIRQGSSRFCGASYSKRCKGPKAPHTDSRQVTRVQSANLGDVGMSEECLCRLKQPHASL